LLRESIFQNKNIRLIGLFSTEVENEKDYIEKLGVKFDALQKTSFKNLKIPSTPTIIVIDKDGLVVSVWRGKLSSDKEQEFLSRLK
jgi:peroxiredoxin